MKTKIVLFLIVATTSVAGLCFADPMDSNSTGSSSSMGSNPAAGSDSNPGQKMTNPDNKNHNNPDGSDMGNSVNDNS